MKRLLFISSVQSEFRDERRSLQSFIESNHLLNQHFTVFRFEGSNSKDFGPEALYMAKVRQCSVIVSLIGKSYGWEHPSDGISPTEREFNLATECRKTRLVFVKELHGKKRESKMAALLARISKQVKHSTFESEEELNTQVYDSLVDYLEEEGIIRKKPFDAAACEGAALKDISPEHISRFLQAARSERRASLSPSASPQDVLTHLSLVDGNRPTNAAILAFGRDPQRFVASALVKCAHYKGSLPHKPILDQKHLGGTLFEQVDGAVAFVLSAIARSVGLRAKGAAAPVSHEIPEAAISELIVNAVAHRGYGSAASVQVSVFPDRVEVSNPGRLPDSLTPEGLLEPHSSEPPNPLIMRPLYLAHYVESLGTGTLDVARLCSDAHLPVPSFEQRGGTFVATLFRDWLTPELLAGLGLNERQANTISVLWREGRFTNTRYREVSGASVATTKRDLLVLMDCSLVQPQGAGRGAYYQINLKRPEIGS